MRVEQAQELQTIFDERNWAHEAGTDTTEHTLLHLMKDVGKIATYSEAVQHGHEPTEDELREQVVGNIMMHALRLANNLGVNLEDALVGRMLEIDPELTTDDDAERLIDDIS